VCALSDASEILGHPPPAFMRKSGRVPIEVGMSPWPTLVISTEGVEALAPGTLAFLAGKRLAEQRPALLARAVFPSVTELSMLLQTAIRMARAEPKGLESKRDAAATTDGALLLALTEEERKGLREAVSTLFRPGATADLTRWSQLADVTASRAGLLLAGSLAIARKALVLETQSASDLVPRERMRELLLFTVSPEHTDLRGAIGVSVEASMR
jgi:hypothetical protein